MVNAALYYGFLAIFARKAPAVIVGNIATMIPFWIVYALVLLNTVVCLWRRIPELGRELGATPLADHARPRWRHPLGDGASDAEIAKTLRSMGYRSAPRNGGGLLGVRRRWGVLGTFLFHGSFLLLATGFFLTFAYRDESKQIVAVGEERDVAGESLRIDRIDPEFWRDQLLFTSLTADVTLDGDDRARLKINRPLWTGFGRFIRLSNFGFAPEIELRDRGGVVLEAAVAKLGVFPPGTRDHFRFSGFPHRVYVEVYPDAEVEGDQVTNRSLDLAAPVIAARVTRGKITVAKALLRPGEDLGFEGLRLRFPNIRYYAEVAALTDPGAPFLLIGLLVGFAGLVLRAGGRRGEVEWIPGPSGRGGELRGFGTAASPPDDTPERRARGWWFVPGTALTVGAVALWIARWIAAGHLPLFGTYESALSLGAAVMVTSWLWEYRADFRSGAGPVSALVVAALLVHGATFDRSIYALTISERSWVVDVHAVFAWIAFGVLATNAGVSLHGLVRKSADDPARARLIARTLELGFVLHTGMMLTGIVYKFLLFGKSWSFDPIETLGFLAWMSYGTLVHMVRFAHWDGRRLARWCVALFVLLVVSYRFIVYYPSWASYHIFDMDLRMHLV